VGSISEGGHTSTSKCCGGVFYSKLTVGIWLSFNGLGSISEGRTILGRTCLVWTCISAWIKLLLYQVHLYFVLVVFHHLFSSYIGIFQIGFPQGGFIQGHVNQKYLCTFSCVLECRIALFSAVNISRCVKFILVCMCQPLVTKTTCYST
jgi:hypothetical protein